MKYHRLAALATAGVLCFGLLTGCGTSHLSDSESQLESIDSTWQQLTTPTPTPKTDTVMPELDQKNQVRDGGTDVTDDYKNSFVGTWDTDDGYGIYEFKSNENLVITTGKEVANYTYWFEEVGKQVLLYIFENGQEEATTYSFTLSGSNLTLYDTGSGNAVQQLVKRVSVAAPTATATPKPTATAAASNTANPTATPEPSPSPTPSAEPSASPSPSPSVEPSPTPSPELPDAVKKAMPGMECALDVVLDGTAFDKSDSQSFWSVMARYLSRTNGSGDDGTFTVTKDQVLTAAKSVFAGVTELPDLPENSGVVTLVPSEEEGGEDQYQLLWGAAGGHDLEVLNYDGIHTIEVQVDSGKTYQVTIDDNGAIVSVEEA